jgi:glycosyltransferase involved in cell wall biosynthesis
MKILMIAPQPFFEPRGTPISVYQRLWGLSALGHEIDLLTYHVGQDVSLANVRIRRIPRVPLIRQVRIGPSWAKPILNSLLLCHAFFLLLTRQYAVIHSHEEASFFAAPLARLFGVPHLYDMHSSLPRQLKSFNFGNWRPLIKLFRILERRVLHTCDALIIIDSNLETYVRRFKLKVEPVVIENLALGPFDQAQIPDRAQELRRNLELNGRLPVVYTGTFERYQGLELLLESVAMVKTQVPEATFILVGGKPDQVKALMAQAGRGQLEACVHFTGIVPPDEALAYLELAEVVVSPRLDGTGIPLKIYSYLQAGKPILATRVPPHTQVLNDQIALLVEPTAEGLAAGLVQLLSTPALRASLAEKARQFAHEHYRAADYLGKVVKAYQTLTIYPAIELSELPELPEQSAGTL